MSLENQYITQYNLALRAANLRCVSDKNSFYTNNSFHWTETEIEENKEWK